MDIQEKVQSKDYSRATCCTVDQIPYLGFFFSPIFVTWRQHPGIEGWNSGQVLRNGVSIKGKHLGKMNLSQKTHLFFQIIKSKYQNMPRGNN